MPKPTVLMGNLNYFTMPKLYRPWSKALDEANQRIARADNTVLRWLQRSLRRPVDEFRTARRFWAHRRAILKKMIFTYRSISKTGRLQVTGGRHLSKSAAYTRGFARALLAVFQEARFAHDLNVLPHYRKLWNRMDFRTQPWRPRVRDVEQDNYGLQTFGLCLLLLHLLPTPLDLTSYIPITLFESFV